MGFSVGIDLGTTNTVVSTARLGLNSNIEVVTESIPQVGEDGMSLENSKLLPSVLSVTDGIHNVGLVARAMKGQNTNKVIWNSKNFIGESQYSWDIDGVEYTPELVASYFLSAVRKHLLSMYNDEESLMKAVITVPASFNIDQRNATKTAAKIAGFSDVILISEPTAAILDFINEQKKLSDESKYVDFNNFKNVLVFDLGGGTCDVAVLRLKINGKDVYVEEVSVSPHTLVGGANFDAYAVEGVIQEYNSENNLSLEQILTKEEYKLLKTKLLIALEKAKIFFTTKHFQFLNAEKLEGIEKVISFPLQVPNIIGGSPFKFTLTMEKYNKYIKSLLERNSTGENIITPIENALISSGLNINDIDYLFMVGGMSNYPKVKDTIRNYFGKEPLKFTDNMHSVARGAAIYSHYDVSECKASESTFNESLSVSLKDILGNSTNDKYDIIPTLPQTVFLNVKDGFPIPLIKAKTKAGTPVIHDGLIKVSSDVGMTLELYTGMDIFDTKLKKQESVRLEFPYGVNVGSEITLKLEYTQKGVLNFEAYVKNHEDIKVNLKLEGMQLNEEEVSSIKSKYKIDKVGGIL